MRTTSDCSRRPRAAICEFRKCQQQRGTARDSRRDGSHHHPPPSRAPRDSQHGRGVRITSITRRSVVDARATLGDAYGINRDPGRRDSGDRRASVRVYSECAAKRNDPPADGADRVAQARRDRLVVVDGN